MWCSPGGRFWSAHLDPERRQLHRPPRRQCSPEGEKYITPVLVRNCGISSRGIGARLWDFPQKQASLSQQLAQGRRARSL